MRAIVFGLFLLLSVAVVATQARPAGLQDPAFAVTEPAPAARCSGLLTARVATFARSLLHVANDASGG
ncbi:MAG: hypothetical protein U5K76_09680 [Woeseiaceae bacterium]|nr:hypothetical protein [Woeseiaceae bacterium]